MKNRALLIFSLPAIVIAIPTIPIYLYLPTFYAIDLGLGLASTGLILLAMRIFDTLSDPLIGILSDRMGSNTNRRKPWIAIGSILAGVSLYKLLSPPLAVETSYLLGWGVLLYTGWSMVAIPYTAWGAEISKNYNERTRITSWRETLGLLGIICVGVFFSLAANSGIQNDKIMSSLSLGTILIGLIILPLLLLSIPDKGIYQRVTNKKTIRSLNLKILLSLNNALFLRLLFSWFLNGLANGLPAALFLIYLEHVLEISRAEQPIFILTYFLAAIAAIPVWLKLSQRVGKNKTWCFAMSVACIAFIMVPAISEGFVIFFAVICLITGACLGADLVLPPSIQADVVDYDRLKFSIDRTGQQFALWSMGTKFALALSVGLALPAVEWLGFDPLRPDMQGKFAIVMIYAVMPVVIKAIAIYTMWHFPLSRKKHEIVKQRLSKRNEERRICT